MVDTNTGDIGTW